mgnify:CR=1 FL=1
MPGWRLREFHPDDLDGILRLWEQTHRDGSEPVYALSEVLASCQKDYAVVALGGEEVVGACVSLPLQRCRHPRTPSNGEVLGEPGHNRDPLRHASEQKPELITPNWKAAPACER